MKGTRLKTMKRFYFVLGSIFIVSTISLNYFYNFIVFLKPSYADSSVSMNDYFRSSMNQTIARLVIRTVVDGRSRGATAQSTGTENSVGLDMNGKYLVNLYDLEHLFTPIANQNGATEKPSRDMISADPNPCILNSQGKCEVTLYWSTERSSNVQIKLKDNPTNPDDPIFIGATGSQKIEWITETGATFELYKDGSKISEVTVRGVAPRLGTAPTAPTPTIVASPNPCTLRNDGTCKSYLSWNATGVENPKIRIKENSDIDFLAGDSGTSIEIPWITSSGATFEIHSGNNPTVLASVHVNGVKAGLTTVISETITGVFNQVFTSATTPVSITTYLKAEPNPCHLSEAGTCQSRLSWYIPDAQNTELHVTENPGVVLAPSGSKGSIDIPWITSTGGHFELWSDGRKIETLHVYGTN